MKHPVIQRRSDARQPAHGEQLAAALDGVRSLTRRQVLRGGLAGAAGALLGPLTGLLSARRALADEAVKTGKFIFPRLEFAVNDQTGDIWDNGLIGDANLRQKLRELTNINASEEAKVVRLADLDDLCRYPYVFMTSEGSFALSEIEERNMREFLERGGFIHSDDCVISSYGDKFFRCYVDLIKKLFPDNPMRKIPYDHEVFHIYFDFKDGSPHMQGQPHGAFGLFEPGTGRLMTIATPGDLHCGWMNQYWAPEKNLEAIKMGINIIIYFLSH